MSFRDMFVSFMQFLLYDPLAVALVAFFVSMPIIIIVLFKIYRFVWEFVHSRKY